MARPIRDLAGGVVFHVLNRRVMRLPLFEDDADYLAFERVLDAALSRPDAPELFAFCLMPNHWHLLLRPTRNRTLSGWMQWLTVTHMRRWHAHHHSIGSGPVYQGRFKSFPVQEDGHFLTVARYVERNALRARLKGVQRAEQWRWSSLWLRQRGIRRIGEEVEASLSARLAAWPTGMPRNWVGHVNRPQTLAELQALRTSVTRGRPFGSERWTTRTVGQLGLHRTLNPLGRPRKAKDGNNET